VKILEDKLASIQWLEDPFLGGSNSNDKTGMSYGGTPSKSPISAVSNNKLSLDSQPRGRNLHKRNPREKTNKYINDISLEKSKELIKKPSGELFLRGKVIGFALPRGEMSSVSENSEIKASERNTLYSGIDNCIILNKTPRGKATNYRVVHGRQNKSYVPRKSKSRNRKKRDRLEISQKNWKNLSNSTLKYSNSTSRIINYGLVNISETQKFGSISGFELGPPMSETIL
jgi:hypothetical protein